MVKIGDNKFLSMDEEQARMAYYKKLHMEKGYDDDEAGVLAAFDLMDEYELWRVNFSR